MDYRHEDQQKRHRLLAIVDRGTPDQLFTFLQGFHRNPFKNLTDMMTYNGVIDDQIDFIDSTGTRYNITPLIIAAGKGSYEKTKILLVHGADPNKQCTTGDTALNLAVHRQKYQIVDLLLQYRANPNVYNQYGKTALHRAVVSYTNERNNHIRALLNAGADPNIQDRNQRLPLDEAAMINKPEIVDILLSHDQTLVQRAYRAAIIASRLGYDKCLSTLLKYGMNPNITDRTNITPLQIAVRSLQLSTVRLLIANGANPHIANNRGETALNITELLQPDQKENFINALIETRQTVPSKLNTYTTENPISNIYPLLRSRRNWTLDSEKFRSRTAENSSVQNLLDISTRTYWCCTQSKNAWIIFDLKHEFNINGMRIVGCDNRSTPKNGYLEVSNAFKGPWLKVKDFTCLLSQGNKNDFFFPLLKTRFIRVWILNNYGGNDIRIQGIAFFGVDMRLVNLLEEYGLQNSLNTLLANGINDQETLDKNRDEILNSSDRYLHVNDHFQFIHLTESLRLPQLTFLEWLTPPQTTVIAGEKIQTFSVIADEGVTDRVKLEEKRENGLQVKSILMRDLEPIQGQSLVDFPDYIIKSPGRYKIRIVSMESPLIHTPWHNILVGPTLYTAANEYLYRAPATPFFHTTRSDKENTFVSSKKPTTSVTEKDNRAFISKVYESESDDTEDDTYLTSFKPIEDSPYYFPLTRMAYNTRNLHPNYSDHVVQTVATDYYDHTTSTKNYDEDSDGDSRASSIAKPEKILIPTKYRSLSGKPLSENGSINNRDYQEQTSDYDESAYVSERTITPTKHRLKKRKEELALQKNIDRSQNQSPISSNKKNGVQKQLFENPKQSEQPQPSGYDELEQWENQNEPPTYRNTDQNHSKTLLGRYRITSGDIELRKNPSDTSLNTDESKHTQIQLTFDGIVQTPEVQQRAEHSINALVNSRNRTPPSTSISQPIRPSKTPDSNSPPPLSNGKHRDQRPNNNTYNDDSEFQPGSKFNSGIQHNSSGVHSTTVTKNDDYDRYAPSSNNLFSPYEPQGKPTHDSYSPASESNHQPNPLAPSNELTINSKDYNYDGYLEDNRHRPEVNTTPPYGTIRSKDKKNLSDSPLSSPPQSPPKPSEYKAKYYFGKNSQSQLSDDDNDELECATFGHNSQNTPLKNSNVTHNIDYSSRKNPQSPTHNNNYPTPQFQKMTDAETAVGDSLTPKQRRSSGASQSTVEEDRDSRSQLQTSPRHQVSPTNAYELSDAYPESDSETPKKQNVPTQQHANPGHSKSNIESTRKDNRAPYNSDDDVPDKDDRRYGKLDEDGGSNYSGEGQVMQVEPYNPGDDSDNDSPRNSQPVGAAILKRDPVRPVPKSTQRDDIESNPTTPKSPRKVPKESKKTKEPKETKKPGFFARLFGGKKDEPADKKKKKSSKKKKGGKNKKKRPKKT